MRPAYTLETAETAGARRTHHNGASQYPGGYLGQAQVTDGQGDPDELGHNGEGVEYEQVDNAERAPEAADALHYEPGVADTGNGP
jgi:hypothetical protein